MEAEDLEERIGKIEDDIEKLTEYMEKFGERLASVTERLADVAESNSAALNETAALSLYLFMLGNFLENVSGTISPGSLGAVYSTVTDNMAPEVKSGGSRIVKNLRHWKAPSNT